MIGRVADNVGETQSEDGFAGGGYILYQFASCKARIFLSETR